MPRRCRGSALQKLGLRAPQLTAPSCDNLPSASSHESASNLLMSRRVVVNRRVKSLRVGSPSLLVFFSVALGLASFAAYPNNAAQPPSMPQTVASIPDID